jgi:hypothetical protein
MKDGKDNIVFINEGGEKIKSEIEKYVYLTL